MTYRHSVRSTFDPTSDRCGNPRCRQPLPKQTGRGRPRIYCSDSCRSATYYLDGKIADDPPSASLQSPAPAVVGASDAGIVLHVRDLDGRLLSEDTLKTPDDLDAFADAATAVHELLYGVPVEVTVRPVATEGGRSRWDVPGEADRLGHVDRGAA